MINPNERSTEMTEQIVVVGVDGSPGGRAALEYALQEAARRQARVRVIAAAAVPEYWAISYGTFVPPAPAEIVREMQKATQKHVDEIIAARPDIAAGVPVSVECRAGRPGEVLCDAAEGADVLVVGHRGRGSVASALLGSVGLHCVLHASCPVTVVRAAVRPVPGEAQPAAAPARG
jgi:nucleotide-binding universal stress UspA family protein